MTLKDIITTLFEFIAVVAVIACAINEKKLIAFENKIAKNIKEWCKSRNERKRKEVPYV